MAASGQTELRLTGWVQEPMTGHDHEPVSTCTEIQMTQTFPASTEAHYRTSLYLTKYK